MPSFDITSGHVVHILVALYSTNNKNQKQQLNFHINIFHSYEDEFLGRNNGITFVDGTYQKHFG